MATENKGKVAVPILTWQVRAIRSGCTLESDARPVSAIEIAMCEENADLRAALASRSQPQGEPVAAHVPDGKAVIGILRRAMTLAGMEDVTRGMLTLHFSNEWNKTLGK